MLTGENIGDYELGAFPWLKDEIPFAQPYAALVCEGRTASVCRSVRGREEM